MNEIERWRLVSKCGDYKELAIRLARNDSKEIIVAAMTDDDEKFSNEFLIRVNLAMDDGDVLRRLANDDFPACVAAYRYGKLVELLRNKFERIAQEVIAEYLCELLRLPIQNRRGMEWNPWADKPADTHFESWEIDEVAA